MPHSKTTNTTTLKNRKDAAQAISMGYDDADVATILTNAAANGFVVGRLPAQGGIDVGAGNAD
jgi:hypothetical protein